MSRGCGTPLALTFCALLGGGSPLAGCARGIDFGKPAMYPKATPQEVRALEALEEWCGTVEPWPSDQWHAAEQAGTEMGPNCARVWEAARLPQDAGVCYVLTRVRLARLKDPEALFASPFNTSTLVTWWEDDGGSGDGDVWRLDQYEIGFSRLASSREIPPAFVIYGDNVWGSGIMDYLEDLVRLQGSWKPKPSEVKIEGLVFDPSWEAATPSPGCMAGLERLMKERDTEYVARIERLRDSARAAHATAVRGGAFEPFTYGFDVDEWVERHVKKGYAGALRAILPNSPESLELDTWIEQYYSRRAAEKAALEASRARVAEEQARAAEEKLAQWAKQAERQAERERENRAAAQAAAAFCAAAKAGVRTHRSCEKFCKATDPGGYQACRARCGGCL